MPNETREQAFEAFLKVLLQGHKMEYVQKEELKRAFLGGYQKGYDRGYQDGGLFSGGDSSLSMMGVNDW